MSNDKLKHELADIALLLNNYEDIKRDAELFRGPIAITLHKRAEADANLSAILNKLKCLIAMSRSS